MIRGFIIGASIVGFLWYQQWNSPANQEVKAYSDYQRIIPLLPTDKSEAREGTRYKLAGVE